MYNFGIINISSLNSLSEMDCIQVLFDLYKVSFLPCILSIFVVWYVADEFQNGSIKYFIAKGCSHRNLYFTQFVVLGIATILITVVFTLISGIMALAFWGISLKTQELIIPFLLLLLQEWVCYVAFDALCMMVAFLFRNTAGSLALVLSMVFVLPAMLNLIGIFANIGHSLNWVWILNMASDLADLSGSGWTFKSTAVVLATFILAFGPEIFLFEKMEIK